MLPDEEKYQKSRYDYKDKLDELANPQKKEEGKRKKGEKEEK
jgi:hypothetical protein